MNSIYYKTFAVNLIAESVSRKVRAAVPGSGILVHRRSDHNDVELWLARTDQRKTNIKTLELIQSTARHTNVADRPRSSRLCVPWVPPFRPAGITFLLLVVYSRIAEQVV